MLPHPILISGAGIAGLALARQCKKLGLPFQLIEKKSSLSTNGAGIALPANAMAALRHMGLGEQVDAVAHRVTDIIYTKESGKVLSQASLLEAPLNRDHFVALHRNQLQTLLAESLEKEILFESTIDNIAFQEGDTWVTFNSPHLDQGQYSVVIGADGLHSRVRELAFGKNDLLDLKVTNWRWICEFPTDNIQPTYMLGPRDIFMVYPIGPNTVYCYAHCFDDEEKYHQENHSGELLKQVFANYGPLAQKVLERLPENQDIIPGRLRSVPEPYFTHKSCVMIGDASSACSPMLQQGAACAFEDAIVLSQLLSQFKVEDAIKHYQDLRQQRVHWVVKSSDGPMKQLVKMNSQLALFIRNCLIRYKGPLNVNGWRQLLQNNPLAELKTFIEASL